ncbi:MAG: tRNA (adenosine(37)-N6)-threonylcarbamoyltransferase complex ATPase subunit type 1 TsaE, partial [Oscillospiraceae bacterium]|nr:tRNA (adenosine(37)-N6)-threonylcarbamoyltransferase complex ATPase subunit type 1 TsaE [Oscillospiraceae bacterium]
FVRGLARGMGIDAQVTSPTYTIVNEYEGKIPLFHFDMYRLTSEEDLFDIGWEDYLSRGGVCAVEWSENILPALENGYIEVDIAHDAESEDRRIIKIRKTDSDSAPLQLSLDLFEQEK